MLTREELMCRLRHYGFTVEPYLTRYVDVLDRRLVSSISCASQVHHIIPKYVYINNESTIDDSDDNTCILLMKDHALAHFYLMLAAENDKDRAANYGAVKIILRSAEFSDNEMEFLWQLPEFQEHYESYTRLWSKMISELRIGKPVDACTRNKISAKLKGHPVSTETKHKISQANRGKPGPKFTDEQINKMRQARTGKHCSEETKEKLRQINTGKHVSDEVKNVLSEKLKGRDVAHASGKIFVNKDKINKRIDPAEAEEYISKGWELGRFLSEESKAKIVAGSKGRAVSLEHRSKISKSLKGNVPWNKGKKGLPGHPHSQEARMKISLARLGKESNSKGTIWVINENNIRHRILPDQLNYYISLGYRKGK